MQQGVLQQPDVLREQVERMLEDQKSERFVENFTDQWLRLRDIDFTVPDHRLYPEYTNFFASRCWRKHTPFFVR